MTLLGNLRYKFGGSYSLWKLYHLVVADAVALQSPTKFNLIYGFLGRDLGVVADVGCGPGVFTRYLSRHAKVVWAADISLNTLQRTRARHRENSNVRFVLTEASRLPFPGGCFDTIVFLEVLEHLQDDRGAVEELFRLLKPGGKLVLSVPVPPGEINHDDPWGHKREGYTLAELQDLLRSSHLEVEQHGFAQFKFSRLGEKAVNFWRRTFHVSAPIFLSWVCYLDLLLNANDRRAGRHLPSSLVVLARKPSVSDSHDAEQSPVL